MNLQPVGSVKSPIREPSLMAAEHGLEWRENSDNPATGPGSSREGRAEIIIEPRWQELLDGIEGFSHLVVLYWPHLLPEERRSLTRVHPMGKKENPLTGIFAIRSPARPNPVLMTVVRLLARQGNVLRVAGLDAVDGSPVIDIKPYVGEPVRDEEVPMPDWMARILRETSRTPGGGCLSG